MIQSPFQFIVEPLSGQYVNTKKVGDTELIINTSIEDAKDVSRLAKVVSLPMMYDGDIVVGDIAICQHNVFRIHYSDQGIAVQSNHYLKDNTFHITPDLIYMVIRDGQKIAIDENVFVQPIIVEEKWIGEVEQQHVGIIKYSNAKLEKLGIVAGTKVMFRKHCEYEFIIDGERLYKMTNNRILATLN